MSRTSRGRAAHRVATSGGGAECADARLRKAAIEGGQHALATSRQRRHAGVAELTRALQSGSPPPCKKIPWLDGRPRAPAPPRGLKSVTRRRRLLMERPVPDAAVIHPHRRGVDERGPRMTVERAF